MAYNNLLAIWPIYKWGLTKTERQLKLLQTLMVEKGRKMFLVLGSEL